MGILCNVLVCLAVWLATGAHERQGVLRVLFPGSAFVAAGFEHSVANMCLIPLGLLIQDWGPEDLVQAARASAAHIGRPSTHSGEHDRRMLLVGGVYWLF
jgi:formate/nitrite transporter FocA (FNT family)